MAIEFAVLGPLQVIAGDGPVALGRAQQRAVLVRLLLASPAPVSRDRLIDELWGERPPASAEHAIQVYVSGLRKLLRASGDDEVALRSSSAGYALEVDPERIDARRFERLVHEAQHAMADDPARAFDRLVEGLGLWRGPPLAGFCEFEFARLEADRLEDLRTAAVEGLVEARLERGEHAEVIGQITALVAANPLRERPRRLLMLALYRAGRHAEALAAYRDACAALDEIGLQPGPELRELEEAILRHDTGLAAPSARSDRSADRAQAVPEAAVRSSVPAAAHALIGRATELSSIAALLERSDVRLVTLQGPGGSGKTRLALAVAQQAIGRYRDGVWFVSLAGLSDAALVASEIARTVGVTEVSGQDSEATLTAALSYRELLLVLDNFEHLIAAAGLVARLMASAPGLEVLVTSREVLRLRGEHRVEVPPLAISDAVELFLARAREVRGELTVTAADSAAVREICLALDRLPLALELAAARVALFNLPVLAGRVMQRLDAPGGARDLPDRQQTLRATIDWSYQLLSPDEQVVFRALSVFAGGARLEAIESVLDGIVPGLVESVSALSDKSLLRVRDDPDGYPRFWMLETIREFATEQLAADDETAAARTRHAEFFLALAETAAGHLHGAGQAAWLTKLQLDQDNLRAAFDHLVEGRPSGALRLVAALGYFWDIRAHITEARSQLGRALDTAPVEGAPGARASFYAGRFAYLAGQMEQAEPLLSNARRLARDSGDAYIEVGVLTHLGYIEIGRGRLERSVELNEDGVQIARVAADDWALRAALNSLGDALSMLERPDQARRVLEEALEIGRRIDNPAAIATTATNLADVAFCDGDLDEVRVLISESLAAARQIDHRMVIAMCLAQDALLCLHRHELATAASRVAEGLALLRSSYNVVSATALLGACATLAAATGYPLRAAALWAAFEQSTHRIGWPDVFGIYQLRDRWLPCARDSIDPADWRSAWESGSKLAPDQALRLAADAIPPQSSSQL